MAQNMSTVVASRKGIPLKRPADDAADRIKTMAASGFRWVSIAAMLDVSPNTLRKWREEFPELQEAFDEGRERERVTLHSGLAKAAREGNITAAIFLLKAAHGYREGDQSEQTGRVNVTIALPGAMTLEEFQAIGNKETNDDD